MSCTVIALPIALVHVIVSLTTVAVTAAATSSSIDKHNENFSNDIYDENCEGTHTITVNDVVEKVYETPFMDKEILLKTIEEHGIYDIKEEDGKVSGKIDTFNLLFEKPEQDKPYNLKITCNKKDNTDEKVNDISSEYGMNVQEAAYLSIVEKLKENNMEIEEEVVEDDNTIVLTVNLE